jgi:hypothetical protein
VAVIEPYEVALAVKECLCRNLESTLLGKVCRCSIYPSDIPTADICSKSLAGNGEAKVHISRIFNSKNFPNPEFDFNPCRGNYVVVEVVQTVWRCGPSIGDDGQLPSILDVETATMSLLDDAKAMRCAIQCCLDTTLISMGDWTILSLQGGCMGGQLTSLIGIDQDDCLSFGSSS